MTRLDADRCPAGPARDALRRFARTHAVAIDDIGAVIGLDQRVVASVMGRRWLPFDLADEIAVALRRHPCDLWPDWFPRRRLAGVAGSRPRQH